jgi:DNA repair and recombination protein RAD52
LLIELDFDEADFGDSNDPDPRPDEVVLPISMPSHHLKAGVLANASATVGGLSSNDQNHRHRATTSHAQSMPAPARLSNGNHATEANAGRGGPPPYQQQSNTNNANIGLARPNGELSVGAQMRPPQETVTTPRYPQPAPPGHGRVLNQPSRASTASAPHSPANQQKPMSGRADEPAEIHGVSPAVESGFFSARAATMLPEMRDTDGPPPMLPGNLPAFNPHAESPSIRKTPGINHNQTMPLTKELKHVPVSAQTGAGSASGSARPNVVNPQLDATRRIGVPGSPSPMANRNMYKPPTMKRPYQGQGPARPPLGDLPTNETLQVTDGGGDMKRARMNGS